MTWFFYRIKVSVEPHWSLNYSKDVTTCRGLLHISLDEIKIELADLWLKLMGIMETENGKKVSTASLVLKFCTLTVPAHIFIGQQWPVVSAYYVPKPQNCFKCQSYGHLSSTCTKPEVCWQCGLDGTNVMKDGKCCNCSRDHLAYSSNSAPNTRRIKLFLSIMSKDQISFNDAWKLYKASNLQLWINRLLLQI